MRSNTIKKCMYVLSLVFFFVLVLPFTGSTMKVEAKESTIQDSTQEKEVQPEIKLNVKSKDLVKEKSYTLKIYNTTAEQTVTFESDDESIVTVDDEGKMTGVNIGTTFVTAHVKEGSKVISALQCEITVGVPAISIRWTTTDLFLVVGQRTTLRYLIAPYNTVEVARFTSLSFDIVGISTGGRITAKEVGSTFVYAMIDNGLSRCKVTVVDEETYQKMLSDISSDNTSGETSTEVIPTDAP